MPCKKITFEEALNIAYTCYYYKDGGLIRWKQMKRKDLSFY